MSATINGTTISLTKGDTLKLEVIVLLDGEAYTLAEGDTMRFALKQSINDANCLINKSIPTDTRLLYLTANETKALAVGSYKYDIELTTANGDVDTFIGPAIFNITEEVY